MKKINQTTTVQANSIGGISGDTNIADHWRTLYSKLLNTNLCNVKLKSLIMSKLDGIQYSEDMTVTSSTICEIISKLKSGKSSGPDGI